MLVIRIAVILRHTVTNMNKPPCQIEKESHRGENMTCKTRKVLHPICDIRTIFPGAVSIRIKECD